MNTAVLIAQLLARGETQGHPTLFYTQQQAFENDTRAVDATQLASDSVQAAEVRVWVFGQRSSLTLTLTQ
jgi:hypothetical protein